MIVTIGTHNSPSLVGVIRLLYCLYQDLAVCRFKSPLEGGQTVALNIVVYLFDTLLEPPLLKGSESERRNYHPSIIQLVEARW